MKKILITGANSYIGTHVENWLVKENSTQEKYKVDTLDMLDVNWINKDFTGYDVVFHVAGIVHQKETSRNESLYYEVNERLAISVAEKAKHSGIGHFIILSSMSVYGFDKGHITKSTLPSPKTHYGKSKYNADNRILEMANEKFVVSIVRPQMVYGKGCKGNYGLLRKIALKSPIFPKYNNERSMIYIDNLAIFIQKIIDGKLQGVFLPQDREFVNTSKMVLEIARCNNRKCMLCGMFAPFIHIGKMLNITLVNKVFGNLTYERCDVVEGKSFVEIMQEVEKNN